MDTDASPVWARGQRRLPFIASTRLLQGTLDRLALPLPHFLLSTLLFTLLLSFSWPASKNIIQMETQKRPSLIALMKRVLGVILRRLDKVPQHRNREQAPRVRLDCCGFFFSR